MTPSKISNPFSQALPHTMMKLLQLINPKNTIQNNNTQDPSQKPYSEISKLSAIFESLNSEKDLEYPKQVILLIKNIIFYIIYKKTKETPQNKIISKVLLVNKASELNKANPSSFLNKNLYVEFLASLYKQNKMQKPNEDNSNMNKTFSSNSSLNANQENFNFSTFKKENSSPNNGSFSHHEESPDSDELSSSNDNLKSKSKKM